MSTYTTSANARWLHVFWPSGTRHSADTDRALAALEQIPGVRVHPNAIDIPCTTLMLEAAGLLFDSLGKPAPFAPGNRDSASYWEPARALLAHQRTAVERGVRVGNLLLCDEPGLGKTQSAAAIAETFRQQTQTPVVILGPLFARSVWYNELTAMGAIDSPFHFCALETRNINDKSWRPNARYYFIHFDIAEAWATRFHTPRPAACIVDEAHNIRNGRAKRSRAALLYLGPARSCLLLTGTPLVNKPADLWNLLQGTTGTGTWGSPTDFRVRYSSAVHNGFGFQDGPASHVEELRKRMAPWYIRREVGDTDLELPELSRQVIDCPMPANDQRAHDGAFGQVPAHVLVKTLVDGHGSTEALSILHKLRTITSAAKLSTTVELLQSYLEQGESAVVFVWQRATAVRLFERFAGENERAATFCVHGDVAPADRDADIEAFQGYKGAALLFATYGTLREGVTLHKARFVVHHDLELTPSAMQQAERRIHRIGQPRACVATWMVAQQSIDTIFARILARKLEMQGDMLHLANPYAAQLSALSPQGVSLEDEMVSALSEWRAWA